MDERIKRRIADLCGVDPRKIGLLARSAGDPSSEAEFDGAVFWWTINGEVLEAVMPHQLCHAKWFASMANLARPIPDRDAWIATITRAMEGAIVLHD